MWSKMPLHVRKYGFIFVTVLFYLFMAAYYMGPAFTHCTDSLRGIGDNTGGPVWHESLRPSQPLLGGYEHETNYPEGESLYSPVGYATLAETTALTAASKVVGPVCAYNLSNIVGYLTTSIIMFAFIIYLTKSRWIAFLAGYAVAFTPYIQSKIGGHPSYAYGSLLISIIWLILHIVKTRKKRFAVLLALVLAVCTYFDPYYILLSGTIVMPMLAVWLIYSLLLIRRDRRQLKTLYATIKPMLVGLGVLIILTSPLAIVRVKDAGLISTTVSGSRGNVFDAAMMCSNKPLDYLLPDPLNVPLVDHLGPGYTSKNIKLRNWCGFGESRVSVSLTMLAVVSLGVIIVVWERVNRRRTKMHRLLAYKPQLLVWSIVLVGLSAFMIGLPPHLYGYRMPSDLILKITSTWRIFAREYMVVNIAVVIMFAVIIKYFSSIRAAKTFRWVTVLIYIALWWLIMSEYLITTPFNPLVFSYSRDVPSIYHTIKNDKSINAIAEYPLDRIGIEHDSIVYYLTMQTYHKKPLFNSALANDSKENIHIAMKDLSDPQTIPALRDYGIHYVVIHGLTPAQILARTNQLQIIGDSKNPIFSLQIIRSGGTDDSVLTKIKPGPKARDILTIKRGFVINLNIMQSPMHTEFEVLQDAQLTVTPLMKPIKAPPSRVCFDTKMSAAGDSGNLTVSVNGVPMQTRPITDTDSTYSVNAGEGDVIQLHNSNGHNMRLNNLGCR